jgi:hypothetical protein
MDDEGQADLDQQRDARVIFGGPCTITPSTFPFDRISR